MEATWDNSSSQGQELKETTILVPQSLVTEGNNQLRLIPQGRPGDVSLVDYVRLTYQHALTADNDSLRLAANAQQLITIDDSPTKRFSLRCHRAVLVSS